MRIVAKKARYGAEFFHDLMPGKTVKHYVAGLSRLQDRLGVLNDMAVAEHLLPELENGNAKLARQAAFARGYIVADSQARSQQLGKRPLAAVANCA